MSIAQGMRDLVASSNDKYDKDVNELYRQLIAGITIRARQGQVSYKYCTSGPFDKSVALHITGKLRSRLLVDGFKVQDAYSVNGDTLETTFSIEW